MTCAHGFIGACAECDGGGQVPEFVGIEPRPDCEHVYITETLDGPCGSRYVAQVCVRCGGERDA